MERKSVNIDAQIAILCDKAVSELKRFGMNQYNSRSAYVKEACIQQLIKDGILDEKQVTQSTKSIVLNNSSNQNKRKGVSNR